MADDVHLKVIAEWRAALEAVQWTGCEVITIPVLHLRMILNCCDPAWIATSENGVRALAVPVRPVEAAGPSGANPKDIA